MDDGAAVTRITQATRKTASAAHLAYKRKEQKYNDKTSLHNLFEKFDES